MQKKSEVTAVSGKKQGISMWGIIVTVILALYILSFIIPSGSFQRDGKQAIPGTFAVMEKVYLNPIDVIMEIGNMAYSSFGGLFITILIMGGLMGIVNSTGAIDLALNNIIAKLKEKTFILIPVFILVMGFLGALGTMISTAVLFIPVGLKLAKKMKVDRAFAMGLIVFGSHVGFMSSPVNTLTTVMGQEIAGLEPYSASGFRMVVTVTTLVVTSVYLIWYVKKVNKNPRLYEESFGQESAEEENQEVRPLTLRESLVLAVFAGGFVVFALGAPLFHFSTLHLGSIMFPLAILCGLIAGYGLETTMKHFVDGSKTMVGVIIFMIFTSVMNVILNQSMILDTIVYYFSIPLNALGGTLAAIGMFISNALINVFITSGSGQTAVMMPIMAPLSDVIGVSRQMAVLTLQLGDGFTNMLTPTNVNILACLAATNIGFKQWYKIALPLHALLFVVICVFITIGMAIGI